MVSAGTDGTAASDVEVEEENDKGLCLRITFRRFVGATCGDVNGTDEGSRTDVESAVADAIGPVHFAKINHHARPTAMSVPSAPAMMDLQHAPQAHLADGVASSTSRGRPPPRSGLRRPGL